MDKEKNDTGEEAEDSGTVDRPLKDIASRDFCITSFLKDDADIDKACREYEAKLKANTDFYQFQLEKAPDTGALHFQTFIQYENPRHWSTVVRMLDTVDCCKHSYVAARRKSVESCLKYTSKEKSRVKGPFSGGEVDLRDKQGKRTDLEELRELVEMGFSKAEILYLKDLDNKSAHVSKWLGDLVAARDEIKMGQSGRRDMTARFTWGPTGAGKSSRLLDSGEPVYRITNYTPGRMWDGYDPLKHRIVFFDEFNGQIPLTDLLVLLDPWVPTLDCRYHNKPGLFERVEFASNVSPYEMYREEPQERRRAWFRRLDEIEYIDQNHNVTKIDTNLYDADYWVDPIKNPMKLIRAEDLFA